MKGRIGHREEGPDLPRDAGRQSTNWNDRGRSNSRMATYSDEYPYSNRNAGEPSPIRKNTARWLLVSSVGVKHHRPPARLDEIIPLPFSRQ